MSTTVANRQNAAPTVQSLLANRNLAQFRQGLYALDREQLQALWRTLQDLKAPLVDFFKRHYEQDSHPAITVLVSLPMPAGLVNSLRLSGIQAKLQIMIDEVPKMDKGLRAEIAKEQAQIAKQEFLRHQLENLKIQREAMIHASGHNRGNSDPSRLI